MPGCSWSPLIKVCVATEANGEIDPKFVQQFIPYINETAETGSSPLHFVALGQNIQLATWLLENGAIFVENDNVETPLHWACRNGYVPMVKLLLTHMSICMIEKKDLYGKTALSWAKEYEHSEIISLIKVMIKQKKPKFKPTKPKNKSKSKLQRRVSSVLSQIKKYKTS